MSGIICKSIMDNCQNLYDSYGQICVGCNCCGRMGEDTMWQARYELAVRQLNELAEDLLSEHFQTNLQQKNICSNIKYWSENLKEILKHLDFDKEEGQTMSREKQIDIIRDLLTEFDEMGFVPSVAVPDTEAYAIKWRDKITKALEDYFKQSEEIEKCRERVVNQREELRRLNKRITDLSQSREVWKKQAERVGKQLHEVLSKQSEGEWKIKSEIHQMLDDVDEELYVECPFCQRTFWVPYELEDEKIFEYAREHYPYCNCGAKMKGGAE